jgi:[CysO sulfur-carrier protein]-S-L-cysteine hydrolase
MRIARALLDEVIAHARAEAPNECVGVIASRDGEAVAVHRATNAAASPLRYEIDAKELFTLHEAIDSAGLDLGAIYHSHTRSAPEPSQTDINLAFYPEAVYIIVGLAGGEADVRAWRIVGGEVSPTALEVED